MIDGKRQIITIIGWKRPYYLKQVLDSILNSYGYENYDFHISIDYHPQTRDETIKVIQDFSKNIKTKVFVELQNQNIGNTGNTRRSADFAFIENNYDYMLHLEDDSIIGKDCILWTEWAINNFKDDPNCFCFCPFNSEDGRNKMSDEYKYNIKTSFKKYWFDSQGGFAITKKQYQEILDDGGFFGAAWNHEPARENRDFWKANVFISDMYAYDAPMNFYFRKNRYTISPHISRSNNIGELDGAWNPGKEWHNKHVMNSEWINSTMFEIISKSDINYTMVG